MADNRLKVCKKAHCHITKVCNATAEGAKERQKITDRERAATKAATRKRFLEYRRTLEKRGHVNGQTMGRASKVDNHLKVFKLDDLKV